MPMFCSECGSQAEDGTPFCATCGAQLEAPAQPAPPPVAPPGDEPAVEVAHEPAAPPASPPGVLAGLASGRRAGPKIVAGAGVIAIIAVIAVLLGGMGGSGGAKSPVAAVQSLAAALDREDLAAALATIAPDEARDVADLYDELRKDAGGGVRPEGGIAGAKVSVTDLRLVSDDLGHGVAKVRATAGRLSAAMEEAAVPSAIVPRTDDTATMTLDGERDEYVMARRQDGAWFVSPLLTVLQQIVEYADLPQPDFSLLDEADDESAGASTPQELMSSLAEAMSEKNVDGLLDLLSDRELGVVRPYRAAAQQLVGRISASVEVTVPNTDIEERSLGAGLVRLDIKHASASVKASTEDDYAEVSVRLNGLCAEVRGSETFDGCDTVANRVLGINDAFVVAEKTGGRLRLAPIATAKAYLDTFREHIGSNGIKRVLGTVAGGGAGATLTSGASATGRLNDAGYAVHAYNGRAGELVAIDTDRAAMMVAPGGAPIPALGCQYGTALFKLPTAGTYKVVVSGARYKPGSYRIVAERVTATDAPFPGTVSGTVGDGARVVVFKFDKPEGYVQFDTSSRIGSMIEDPDDDYPQYDCRGGSSIGPASLFAEDDDEPRSEPPRTYDFGTGSYDTDAAGERLLIVVGDPGTRFSGALTTNYSYEE